MLLLLFLYLSPVLADECRQLNRYEPCKCETESGFTVDLRNVKKYVILLYRPAQEYCSH